MLLPSLEKIQLLNKTDNSHTFMRHVRLTYSDGNTRDAHWSNYEYDAYMEMLHKMDLYNIPRDIQWILLQFGFDKGWSCGFNDAELND